MKQILIRAFSLVLAVSAVNAAFAQNSKGNRRIIKTTETVTVPVAVPVTTTTVTTNGTVIRKHPKHTRKWPHDNGKHKGWYKKGRHHGKENEQ